MHSCQQQQEHRMRQPLPKYQLLQIEATTVNVIFAQTTQHKQHNTTQHTQHNTYILSAHQLYLPPYSKCNPAGADLSSGVADEDDDDAVAPHTAKSR
jgi:hypothetical protein